jgi:hypothetical protein
MGRRRLGHKASAVTLPASVRKILFRLDARQRYKFVEFCMATSGQEFCVPLGT